MSVVNSVSGALNDVLSPIVVQASTVEQTADVAVVASAVVSISSQAKSLDVSEKSSEGVGVENSEAQKVQIQEGEAGNTQPSTTSTADALTSYAKVQSM